MLHNVFISLPPRLSLERSVLHYLVSNPGDYLGAIQQLPRTLRSMYVSAVQSWIFNTTLSMRIQDGRSLFEPEVGDRLIWPDGRTDKTTPATIHAAKTGEEKQMWPGTPAPGDHIFP